MDSVFVVSGGTLWQIQVMPDLLTMGASGEHPATKRRSLLASYLLHLEEMWSSDYSNVSRDQGRFDEFEFYR
jgi:hypothetical protein